MTEAKEPVCIYLCMLHLCARHLDILYNCAVAVPDLRERTPRQGSRKHQAHGVSIPWGPGKGSRDRETGTENGRTK